MTTYRLNGSLCIFVCSVDLAQRISLLLIYAIYESSARVVIIHRQCSSSLLLYPFAIVKVSEQASHRPAFKRYHTWGCAVILNNTRPVASYVRPDHSRADIQYNSTTSRQFFKRHFMISLFIESFILAPPTQMVPQLDWGRTDAYSNTNIFLPASLLVCVGLQVTAGQLLGVVYIYLYVSIYCATSELIIWW